MVTVQGPNEALPYYIHTYIHHQYVDDIMIIYNVRQTNVHNTLEEFNAINPKLKFTIEKQADNTISFLDLTISNLNGTLDCSIFRKPTVTATIIHSNSCHPNEQKIAAIRYLNNRINTYALSEKNKTKKDVIEAILHNNGYHTNCGPSYRKSVTSTNRTVYKNRKYVTFTYHGPKV
jgi:hypothetical protein